MKKGLLLLMLTAACLTAQIVTINGSDLVSDSRTVINSNFSYLDSTKVTLTSFSAVAPLIYNSATGQFSISPTPTFTSVTTTNLTVSGTCTGCGVAGTSNISTSQYSSFAAACAAAVAAKKTLYVDSNLLAMTTQSCAATLEGAGGKLQPGASQVLTVTVPVKCVNLFDVSVGGVGSVKFSGDPNDAGANPRCFGATGNGATDDTLAMRATIRAAEAGAQSTAEVRIPGGYYNISNPGLVSAAIGAKITGAGSYGNTMLHWIGDGTGTLLEMAAFHPHVSDLYLYTDMSTGWAAGFDYEGSQGQVDHIVVDCNSHPGNGINIGVIDTGQADQLQFNKTEVINCSSGKGIFIGGPNSGNNLDVDFYNVSVGNSWIGLQSGTSNNTNVYGGEFDTNDINFLPGIGGIMRIDGVRSEWSKRIVWTNVGGADQPFTLINYQSSAYNDERPATTVSCSAGSAAAVLSVPGFTFGDFIVIAGAGPAGAALHTAVQIMTDPTHITLGNACGTNVTVGAVTMDTGQPYYVMVENFGGPYTHIGNVFNNVNMTGTNLPQLAGRNGRAYQTWTNNTWGGMTPTPYGPGTVWNARDVSSTGNTYDANFESGGPYYMRDVSSSADLAIQTDIEAVGVNLGASLQSVCAKAAAAGSVVTITQTWQVASNYTCAADVQFVRGGLIQTTGGGVTVTFSGAFSAPPQRIFDIATYGGKIVLATAQTGALYAQWWGVAADGSANDTNPMQEAITAALASGKELVLPGGVIKLTGALNIAPAGICNFQNRSAICGLTMTGQGIGVTTVWQSASGQDAFVANPGVTEYPYYDLRSFGVFGSDSNCPGSSGNGLYVNGFQYVTLRNLHFMNFCGSGKSGLWLNGPEGFHIENVKSDNSDTGIKLSGAANAGILTNVQGSSNWTAGLDVEGTAGGAYTGVTMQGNHCDGIRLNGASAITWNNVWIEANNNTGNCFGLRMTSSIGNKFYGMVRSGLQDTIGLFGASGYGNLTQGNWFFGSQRIDGNQGRVFIGDTYSTGNYWGGFPTLGTGTPQAFINGDIYTGTAGSGSTSLTLSTGIADPVYPGQTVSGTGIAPGTTVASVAINTSNPYTVPMVVTLSQVTTMSLSSTPVTFGSVNTVNEILIGENGKNCDPGSFPLGVDASGNAEDCTILSAGGGLSGTGYGATSVSSLTVGTGSKVFATQVNLAYSAGARVRASSAADTTNFMEGTVTSYTGGTVGSFVSAPPTAARNNVTGSLGFTFQVSTSITVTSLGRVFQTGNVQNHIVKLWISTDTVHPLAAATSYASTTGDALSVHWSSITPLILTPGHTYALMTDENSGGDLWPDDWALGGRFSSYLTSVTEGQGSTGGYPTYIPGTPSTAYSEPAMQFHDNTGSITMTSDAIGGSGTHADWNLNVAGSVGATQMDTYTSGPVTDTTAINHFLFNNAAGAMTFNLPAAVAGMQHCFANAVGKTGIITVAVASGNTIAMAGVNGTASTGTLVSGGALGDSACVVSDAANHWYAYTQTGTWVNN